MKVLNLYAGIGGNRKLWENVEVTAIEINPEIAKIYQDLFPKDKVIVGDAHEYLLKNYKKFNFIWSSPPCPSHSRICFSFGENCNHKYPDMKLYEEIIFLKYWFKGNWIVENVISYYKPLIKPQKIQGHYIWSNKKIGEYPKKRIKVRNDIGQTYKKKMLDKGIKIDNWCGFKGDKRTLINNAIESDFGLFLKKQVEEL